VKGEKLVNQEKPEAEDVRRAEESEKALDGSFQLKLEESTSLDADQSIC